MLLEFKNAQIYFKEYHNCYLHSTLAHFNNFKQHHVFHSILLMMTIHSVWTRRRFSSSISTFTLFCWTLFAFFTSLNQKQKKTSWLTYITLTILENWKQKYQESCWLSFNLIYRRMSFKYKKVTWQLRPLCFPLSSHYFLIL